MEDKRAGVLHKALKYRFRRAFFENQRKYSKNIAKFGDFVELIK
jgi:hypothetical protein